MTEEELKHVGLGEAKGLCILPFPYPLRAPTQPQEGKRDQGGVILCASQVKEIWTAKIFRPNIS